MEAVGAPDYLFGGLAVDPPIVGSKFPMLFVGVVSLSLAMTIC